MRLAFRLGLHPSNARCDQGYTLVELLVVLGLVALLVVSYLSLSGRLVGSADLRALSSRVVNDLTSARDAAAMGTATTVAFDTRSWAVQNREPVTLPDGVSFIFENPPSNEGTHRLTFYPDGSVAGGIIVLMASGARTSIIIDKLTGRITLSAAE